MKNITFLFSIFLLLSWTQQDDFEFQKGNQKMKLELETGKRYLKWGEKTKIKISFENIDPQKLSYSAPGIRILRNENTNVSSTLEITPEKNIIKNDTLKIFVSGREENDSIWFHKFKILIKK